MTRKKCGSVSANAPGGQTVLPTYQPLIDIAATDSYITSPASLSIFELAEEPIEPEIIFHTCAVFSS